MARELDFAFPLLHGLHARPAGALGEVAGRYRAAVTLENRRTGRTANARSTLALVATLTRQGDPCTLRAVGADEGDALDGLRRFVEVELRDHDEASAAPPSTRPGVPALPRALVVGHARVIRGVSVSEGIARARAVVAGVNDISRVLDAQPRGPAAEEAARVDAALAAVGAALRSRLAAAAHPAERAICSAQLSILADPELRARIEHELIAGGAGAARAVLACAEHFAGVLAASGSAYLAERAIDIRELAGRLVEALAGEDAAGAPAELPGDAVWVAAELGPARLLALDRTRLKAIALARGGVTSHTAILARALGIPCVTGLAGIERAVASGDEIVVDGGRGLVVADPSPAVAAFYATEMAKLAALRGRTERGKAAPGRTADGRRIEVAANVGSLDEVRLAFAGGAEGIGLFRTEFLFMGGPEPPGEYEQALLYAEAARLAGDRTVTVRTLDVGGDKALGCLALPAESNPFLGFRAIRMYHEHVGIIAAQVRAILRASAAGPVRIMLPMVAVAEEVAAFRGLLVRLMAGMAAEGVPHDPRTPLGVMVEVPSAAFAIDRLAEEAEFFSIGSNDLAQYFFAAERDNERVAHLADPLHPAFLRLLQTIVDGAHRAGRPVGLCGELAGDARAVPLLVGLGLDELSMAAPRVARSKSLLARCDSAECRELLAAALAKSTAAEVAALLRDFASARLDASPVSVETVRLGSPSRSREAAIRELVDLLHLAGRIDDADRVEDAVWAREDVASTGVGFAVAIPHCASAHVLVDSIAVVRFAAGVEWQSLDGEPVSLAILIAVRADAQGDAHLRMIATLARRLMDEEFRAALLHAPNETETVALLRDAGAPGGS